MTPMYYIAPYAMVRLHQDRFESCHMVWADKDTQMVLVKIHFPGEAQELFWRLCPTCGGHPDAAVDCPDCKGSGTRPGVDALPHPVLEHNDKIRDDHADMMQKRHGNFGIKRGCSMKDVITAVSHRKNPDCNPLMRLQVF